MFSTQKEHGVDAKRAVEEKVGSVIFHYETTDPMAPFFTVKEAEPVAPKEKTGRIKRFFAACFGLSESEEEPVILCEQKGLPLKSGLRVIDDLNTEFQDPDSQVIDVALGSLFKKPDRIHPWYLQKISGSQSTQRYGVFFNGRQSNPSVVDALKRKYGDEVVEKADGFHEFLHNRRKW